MHGHDRYMPITIGLLVQAIFYGIHSVLFALSIYLLWKRRTNGYWIHLVVILTLFLLSTVSISAAASSFLCDFLASTRTYSCPGSLYPNLNYRDALFVPLAPAWRTESANLRLSYILSSCIADIYFTYRCFIVWGQLKRAIIIPLILIIISLVFQIVEVKAPGQLAYYADENVAAYGSVLSTFLTNIVLTFLTAGRIWWIGRKADLILNQSVQSKYNRTIQIILESGLLYPVALLPPIILWSRGVIRSSDETYVTESLIAVSLSIVTIAPTLIIVRVGLGIAARDVPTTVRTFKAVSGPGAMTMDEDSGMSISVIDVRRSAVTVPSGQGAV